MERGRVIEKDAARRVRKAGCMAGKEQVRKVIFRERWQSRKCSAEEIRKLLKQKERDEPERGR